MKARRGGGGGSGGEQTWCADGYPFAWVRLPEARTQEPGDSPEAPEVHSVGDRTSRRGGWGSLVVEVVEVRHGEPGEGEAGGPFWILVAAVQRCGLVVHNAGDDCGRADCGGHGLDPRDRGPNSQATCQKRRGSGEKRVRGAAPEANGGTYVFVLVCIPPGWRSRIQTDGGYSGGESSWFLGNTKGDHWPEMVLVV